MRDALAIDVGMPAQLALEPAGRADERDAQIEVPRGRERAVDDVPRRVVAAHRVDGNPNHAVRVGARSLYSSSTARAWRPR